MLNGLINFTLKNKFAVWLLTIIITFGGLYAGTKMKMETLPDITTPLVTVTTIYPGATPEQVADKVTKPLEQQLQNQHGVKVVSSSSMENVSQMQIEYSFSTNMEKAEDQVKRVVSAIALPDGVQEPRVSRLSFNAFPVLALSISDDQISLAELTKQVEGVIQPKLESIDGIGGVQITGQYVNEGQLTFDAEKLKQYNLTEDIVKAMIQGSNLQFPLGLYTFGNIQQSVVVDGQVTTTEDLSNLEIPYSPIPSAGGSASSMGNMGAMGAQQGAAASPDASQMQMPANMGLPTVKLGELAKIEIIGKAESISRTNGKEAIGLQIIKGADANTVEVVNQVKDMVEDFEQTYPGMEFTTTLDQGKPIEESVSTMLSKALFGAGFAMLIILLFLRNIRTTIISVVSIPLSLLIAVLALNQLDVTLNIMTLGAMTVAIGRVVDDSIVVVENIYRRLTLRNEPLKGRDLIREATKEMFMPIMSSTIVTIAVFLPLALVEGMIGEMFMPFALTIVFALLASLLVAITIVPVLAHTMFKKGIKLKDSKHNHEEHPSRLSRGYKQILKWTLNHKIVTSLVAVVLLVGSLFLTPFIGVSFIPTDQEKMVIATYNPEPGMTLEDVAKVTEQAEQLFMNREGVETVQYSLGGENPMSPGQSNQALFFAAYNKDTKNFANEQSQIIKDLQDQTDKGTWGTLDFGMGGMGGSNIKLYVYGPDLETIKPVVQELESKLNDVSDLKNVSSSLSESYDEYTLAVNQEKLSRMGLTTAEVGMALMQQRTRPVLTTVEKDGQEMNVYLKMESPTYGSIDDLLNRTITSRLGQQVAIKDVVDVNQGTTSDTVTRRGGRLVLDVSAEITSSSVTDASKAVQEQIDAMKLPNNVEITTGGVTADIQESFTQLGIAMLAAIAIVYFILVVTFGGGLAPFAILFSLPFTIIGALVALLISGETISISALIGMLMLIGIVVTNAIVFIDRVIHKEREGMSTRDALLEAGVTRLRPILMTAIATIGALIPMALGIEGSGIISRGLGVTVIGGLASSTLLTLVIVPIVYESLMKLRRKDKEQRAAA